MLFITAVLLLVVTLFGLSVRTAWQDEQRLNAERKQLRKIRQSTKERTWKIG